jgi:HPt (histidine-containing phosphotransfer) domain-containing protein
MQPILDQTVLLSFRSLEHDGVQIVDELIELFLLHTQPLLDSIAHSSDDPNTSTFRITLHRLKGSSASIGALRLAHLCEELEQQTAAGIRHSSEDILAQMRREYEQVKKALEHFSHA